MLHILQEPEADKYISCADYVLPTYLVKLHE